MLKRHREALENRLDQVHTWGWAQIAWAELYLWYAAERLSMKTYKHILETYRELLDDDEAGLLVTNVSGGLVLTCSAQTCHLDDIIQHGFDNAPKLG